MQYLWTKDIDPPRFPKLEKDSTTEVLIIGGGMAGVLCAMQLQQAGVDYILVERARIGGGITKGTTAVLTAQHDMLYQDMIQKFGAETSKLYLDANLHAVERFRKLSQRIPCDFEERPSVLYSLHNAQKMEQEAAAVQSLGFPARFTTRIALPLPVRGAVCYPAMAQFHPLKFLYGAAANLRIYENTCVQQLNTTIAVTEHATIRANKVIVATHFPFVNRHGLYFAKLYQKRSYVIALKNAPSLACTAVDAAEQGVYLRDYKGFLLVGGGDQRTGKKGKGFEIPRSFAKQYFPGAQEVYAWANQDCISLDGVPYIGSYSAAFRNVFVATGFGLWGMTTSMVAAELLTDQVQKRENHFAPAFRTNRSMLTGQLFSNLGTTLADFAVPTTKRCSHMGCALQWNATEHSWDCPCHGSRFDAQGRVVDSPARKDSLVK